MIGVDIPKGGQALRLTLCPELTLRDLFAAAALAAMDIQISVEKPAAMYMAKSAYKIADAMLAERAKLERAAE